MILAFDTHGPDLSVALWQDGSIIADHFDLMARGQAEHLFHAIDTALSSAGADYADLTALAVGIGPGNFTGLRMSVAAARGLSLSLDLPCRGVSSFDALRALSPEARAVVAGPKGHVYIEQEGQAQLMTEADALTHLDDHIIAAPPEVLPTLTQRAARPAHPAIGIAHVAGQDMGVTLTAAAPSPLYVKAPDAAPPKITAPTIIE